MKNGKFFFKLEYILPVSYFSQAALGHYEFEGRLTELQLISVGEWV
jgi:hypothetical protein